MPWFTITAALLCGYIGVCLSQGDSLRPVISTSHGKVRGVRTFITNEQIPVDKFLGVPYAQPPISKRRFRPPTEAEPWSGIKEATEFSSACYHNFQNTGFHGEDLWNPTVPLSEDCLYLNLWVPRNIQRPMSGLTTLVWIYGGGFYSGSSDLPMYDGSYIAATHNAIVVSMNYRLGPLGFLNLGVSSASGNAGLQDQSLALKWTYQNIEAFDGDKSKIAIFGESAGSGSVSYHLLAPASWNFFSTAIMQSGNALSPWAFASVEDSIQSGKMFAEKVGCKSDDSEAIVTCLRAKPVSDLSEFFGTYKQKPTVDGQFITKPPKDLVENKEFKKCNILLGYNTDEYSSFMSALMPEKFGHTVQEEPSVSLPEIRDLMNSLTLPLAPSPIVPNTSLAVENLFQVYIHGFPKKQRSSNYKIIDDMYGDYYFKCPLIDFARAYAAENLGVYLYDFQHRSPSNPWPEWMGSMHGYEIEFVFGLPYNTSAGYDREDKRISDVLMSYWVNFATKGDPNSKKSGEQHWPKFTENDQRFKLIKSDSLKTKQYPRYGQCSFWRRLLPVLEKDSVSTAEALARCAGCRAHITVLFVLLMSVVSIMIASKNG